LASYDEVAYIEQDQTMQLNQVCTQQQSAIWGLARVSTAGNPVTGANIYRHSRDGEGIRAYIIDTGIRTTHDQFQGRAIAGANFAGGSNSPAYNDGNGHGTHVAGTVAGFTYGVAKKSTVVPVRVLDNNGSGTNSGVIAGVNWTAQQGRSGRDTANMSLGGGASQALDDACIGLATAGITLAVAAGNDGANACNYSPARTGGNVQRGILGVSATSPTFTGSRDQLATFSNRGTCTDIAAPGQNILSAWHTSNTATNTISGTSMASPHVCGVATLIQGTGVHTPAQVKALIRSTASAGTINPLPAGTPNFVLHSAC